MDESLLQNAAPAILEASSEAILTIDAKGTIKGCNKQFLLLAGFDSEDTISCTIQDLFPEFDFVSPRHDNDIATFSPTKFTKPDGTSSLVLIKVIPIGKAGDSFKTILIQDPELIRRIIDHLDYIDCYDVASGLLNRHKGTLEFGQLQTRAMKGGTFFVKAQIPSTVDTDDREYGEVLKRVSNHLKPSAQQAIICRYSISELLVICVSEVPCNIDILRDAIDKIKTDPHLDDAISIWLAYQEWNGANDDLNSIVHNLRHHLVEMYTPNVLEKIKEQSSPSLRNIFLQNLNEALDSNQLQFYIQPQVSSESNHVIGGELLIRWVQPNGQIIPPSQFVDFLEYGDFGRTFLHWSMERSAELLAQIKKECGRWIPLSLNVASNYFSKEVLVDPLVQCMDKYDIPYENLEIEITERVLAENPKDVMHTLQMLHHKGFKAAIDDFGTGYSSLSYLRKFSLDRLKIDRVFVTNLAENEEDRLIAVAIASLAHVLGLEIVAEGVEENAQAAFLNSIGCEYFQGFLTGKPMPADQFISFCIENEKNVGPVKWSNNQIEDLKLSHRPRKVNWKKSFSTDIVSVDNEHRDLIDLLNKATETYLNDPLSLDLGNTFDLIGAETLKHFDHEENVMRNMAYPRYETHRDKHKWLIADLSKRKAEILSDPEGTNFDEVLRYLKYWLLRHLISEDTHLLRYLNKANTP
ncbi:EAL domain-containing protein [Terasakiella sp.]|uniref:EAL domain-containing protein n=1 Tax=Terasakiella sp. TaxID=2034861 RepID=UPI003AA94EFF